jgi:hypothetical protein
VQEWRSQFQKLDSVDLRYDHQVIVNPDSAREITKPSLARAASENGAPASSKAEHKKTSAKAKKHT